MSCRFKKNACFIRLPTFKLSSVPFEVRGGRVGGFSFSDADKLISGHEVHWLASLETYEENRRVVLGAWRLFYQDAETCLYGRDCEVLFAFRGTASTKDLYDDRELALNRGFPRVREARAYVAEFLSLNPSVQVSLTGHSLGGAVAREVSKLLNLFAVTFNAAAPPSAPVLTGNSVDYHIVFDFISAWQSPGTVRIDKGFRPSTSFLAMAIPSLAAWQVFKGVLPSHSLINFSNTRSGVILSSESEDRVFQRWFMSLPLSLRVYMLAYFLGSSGGMTTLPKLV